MLLVLCRLSAAYLLAILRDKTARTAFCPSSVKGREAGIRKVVRLVPLYFNGIVFFIHSIVPALTVVQLTYENYSNPRIPSLLCYK